MKLNIKIKIMKNDLVDKNKDGNENKISIFVVKKNTQFKYKQEYKKHFIQKYNSYILVYLIILLEMYELMLAMLRTRTERSLLDRVRQQIEPTEKGQQISLHHFDHLKVLNIVHDL